MVKKRKLSVSQGLIYLVLSAWALSTIYPFFWVIVNSFKEKRYIRSDTFALPLGEMFTLDNYRTAFERVDILGAYRNSLIISITVTAVVVLLAGFAAYAMARYRFRGRRALQGLIIASMMFPVFSTIIPVFRMLYSWGLVRFESVF